MNLKQLFNRKDILFLFFLLVIFLFSRLVNLLALPIFTDEAIYMRWAQIGFHDASFRFISLTDGKQPMLIWLTIIFMRFLRDPLLSGRLVSVLAGLFGMLGCFFLGWEIFKKKAVGYFSALLYILSPFFLWHDRIALMDSLLSCFFIWSILLEVLLVRRVRLDIALILGLTIGGAILTKTSGFFAIYLMPLMLLLFDYKKGLREFVKLIGLLLISLILANGLYSVLRLSPWFYIINQKDHSFIYTFSEVLLNPFQVFFGNLHGLAQWWWGYFTIPFFLLLLVGLINKSKNYLLERLILFLLFLLPFTALAMFGKVLYPRFILFMVISLLPLSAYGLNLILEKNKTKIIRFFILLILLYPLYFDSQIIFNVINSPLPISDRKQYLDEWPSGYGVNEVIDYLKNEKNKQPIFVATEGTFGLFPYSLELEFSADPAVKIQGFWPLPCQEKLKNEAEGRPAYLILKESQELPTCLNAQLINQYKRGKGNSYLKFFRLTNN